MPEAFARCVATSLLTSVFASVCLGADAVNKHAELLSHFQERTAQYVKLHNKARAGLPPAKPTDSPEMLIGREHALADKIRALRPAAKHGDIFGSSVSAEFRRLARVGSKGSAGSRIQTSLARSEPVRVPIRVNEDYPSTMPLQSTPPTLLQSLPLLPKELEYRLVADRLVLRDVEANLIVDYVDSFLR